MAKKVAIIMAAGLGSRMYPLTEKVPKPLVKVNGIPFVETMIQALRQNDVTQIYIIVGYKKEQFMYLMQKYPGVELLINDEYREKNNLATLYRASHILRSNDSFICEADILVNNPDVFRTELQKSCYFGKMVWGETMDWAFRTDGNRITHIGKGGTDLYNMVGVSYFKREDGKILAEKIQELYSQSGTEQLFWDEATNMILNQIELEIHPVNSDELVEVDTIAELADIDTNYKYLLC